MRETLPTQAVTHLFKIDNKLHPNFMIQMAWTNYSVLYQASARKSLQCAKFKSKNNLKQTNKNTISWSGMNLESLFHVAFCRRSLHTHLTAGWTSTYYELQSNFIIVKLSELSVVTQDKKKQPSTGNTRPVHAGLCI